MAAQWPKVKARLLILLPTLAGWAGVVEEVYNGPPVGDVDAVVYAAVGYVPGNDSGGSYTSTQSPDGFQYIEAGSVLGEIVAASGDDDYPTVEAQAFALLDAFDAAIRADRTLGVLSQEGTAELSADVLPAADGDGAVVTLAFTLSYYTVT